MAVWKVKHKQMIARSSTFFFSFRESWLKLITEEPPVLTCTLHTRLETVDFPPRHMLLSYKSVFLNLPLRSPARYYSFFTNLLCTQFLFHIQSHCWLNSITGKGHKSDFIARRQSRVDEKFLPTTLSKTFGALCERRRMVDSLDS